MWLLIPHWPAVLRGVVCLNLIKLHWKDKFVKHSLVFPEYMNIQNIDIYKLLNIYNWHNNYLLSKCILNIDSILHTVRLTTINIKLWTIFQTNKHQPKKHISTFSHQQILWKSKINKGASICSFNQNKNIFFPAGILLARRCENWIGWKHRYLIKRK